MRDGVQFGPERTDEGRIYVFSAMDLKFVAYDTEGNFIEEYPYEPTIGDFISCGTGR